MKRLRSGSVNPWIKSGSHHIDHSERQNRDTCQKKTSSSECPMIITDKQGNKLDPNSKEYKMIEVELKRQKQKSYELSEKNFIGRKIAEKERVATKKCINQNINNESNDSDTEEEKFNQDEEDVYDDLETTLYKTVIDKIEAVNMYINIDIANEFLWENSVPAFLKAFQEWAETKPETEKMEYIQKEFSSAMNKASEGLITCLDENRELVCLIDGFLNEYEKIVKVKEKLDKKSREYLEKLEDLPIKKGFYKQKSQHDLLVKKNIQDALCAFLNIRNKFVKCEHLLMVIRELSKDKFDI